MFRHSHYKIDPHILEKFLKEPNKMETIYQWTQQNIITQDVFECLIKISIAEEKYQRQLDSPN